MSFDEKRLTSSEVTNLWTQYIRETMAICMSKYALHSIEDPDIRSTFDFALRLSNDHVQQLKDFFLQEHFPIPLGFTEEDVDLGAPLLFTEVFWLEYIHQMTKHGTTEYSLAINSSTRKDIRDYYYQCMNDAMDLYNKSTDVLIKKELYERSPYYSPPQQAQYITGLDYVTDIFGNKRPLNSMESGQIFFNLKKTVLAKAMLVGFSQVCESNDVRKFMEKGWQLANKHIELFSSLLLQDNLHSPRTMDADVTNSSTAPFSDRLMLHHAGFLFKAAITYYGASAVASMRADLLVHNETAITRLLTGFAKFGQLMIKHQWLEQPPQADDRKINEWN